MGARAVLPYEGIDATAHAAVGEVVGRGAGERDDSREVRKRGVTSLCVEQTFLSASLWPDRKLWPTLDNVFAVGKPEQTFLSAFLWPDRNVWPTHRQRFWCGQTGADVLVCLALARQECLAHTMRYCCAASAESCSRVCKSATRS